MAEHGNKTDVARAPQFLGTVSGLICCGAVLRPVGYVRSSSGADFADVNHGGITRSDADRIVPAPEGLRHLRGARGIGRVNDDDTDIEGPALEGRPFKNFHDRPDGVIVAQIMVEPEFIEPVAPVTVEKLDSG